MMRGSCILVLVCALLYAHAYNPDAGLATNYVDRASFIISADSSTDNLAAAHDGNTNSAWSTGQCLPGGWYTRNDTNLLLGICASSPASCATTSTSTTGIAAATDGDPNTSYGVKVGTSSATITITFSKPQPVFRVGAKINSNSAVNVVLVSTSGTSVTVGSITTNYQRVALKVANASQLYTSIQLQSTANFDVFDFAAMAGECFEYLIVDLGSAVEVGWIGFKYGSGTFQIFTSLGSPYQWVNFTTLNSAASYAYVDFIATPRSARYVMLKTFIPDDYTRAYIFEVAIYDRNGPFGAPYSASRSNPRNYSDLLGVNGLWGWGLNIEPSTSTTQGEGLFSQINSYARNYHNLGWDINTPTDVVNYNVVGTPAQPWLSWDQCYSSWLAAGFKWVDASIQFLNDNTTGTTQFSQVKWPNPYQNAYTYAYNFAAHFGPSNKKLIRSMEVGNEPWDYDANFYTTILQGMAKGAKDADPKMMVLPGAMQASHRDNPPNGDNIFYNAKYAGFRIPQAVIPYLDAANTHCYSWAITNYSDGSLRGVMPEYPTTSFKEFRNMLRWRDANMPSKEVWLTEWGWDGSSTCVDSRCVSLTAQAVYGIRGLLVAAREGVDRATWYFYGDDAYANGLFAYSGLVTSPSTGHTKKPVFFAFSNFLSVLSSYHHVEALSESATAYIYILKNEISGNYKLVAWRPIDGDSSKTIASVQQTITGYTLSGNTFLEITQSQTGPTTLANNVMTQAGSVWTMQLSGYPRIANVIKN